METTQAIERFLNSPALSEGMLLHRTLAGFWMAPQWGDHADRILAAVLLGSAVIGNCDVAQIGWSFGGGHEARCSLRTALVGHAERDNVRFVIVAQVLAVERVYLFISCDKYAHFKRTSRALGPEHARCESVEPVRFEEMFVFGGDLHRDQIIGARVRSDFGGSYIVQLLIRRIRLRRWGCAGSTTPG